ncbi:exosome complex exonuclease RRP42 [Echinococcus multilocularis]|uniref:Ribosomal RNA-processing protein 42 n=1 Tax=Echinococcus multilocularis TaxID=6211 RepID=A0A068YCX9_ECHMU|nr:exosome complex exonuclease RRP42 [Echinococcus multilocularis]
MDNTLISDAERFFIIQGAQLGCRLDGRKRSDFRPIEIETGILNHTAGSARVKIGSTIVIACVSIEIGAPSVDAPNEGRLEIDVECSPAATPRFSGKSGSDIADTLKATLSTAFTRECLPFKLLCIQPGKQCWIIHADVLLLEIAGNLLDATSLAIVAVLSTVKLPLSLAQKIATETGDTSSGGDFALSIKNLSMFTTVHKIGNAYIVDADKEEEACSFARVFVAVRADGTITTIIKEGCGSLRIESVMDMIEIGQSMGKGLHAALASALQQERNMKSAS